MKRSISLIALLVLGALLGQEAWAVSVPVQDVPAQLVADTPTELVDAGCTHTTYDAATHTIEVKAGHPLHVISRLAPSDHYLCPVTARPNLTAVEGEVAGIIGTDAEAQIVPALAIGAGLWAYNRASDATKAAIQGAIIRVIVSISATFAYLFSWVLYVAALLLAPFMTQGSFITNDIVRTGWPVIQGVANVGFILALLFIALLTTLNLDFGGGIKKLLPRLLIAALLVNFSLVIGGIIIDVSRILTASFIGLIGGIQPADLGAVILSKTKIIESVYNASAEGGFQWLEFVDQEQAKAAAATSSWSFVIRSLTATVMIAGLAMAFLFLTLLFIIRYIMLLLLLILSPMAYFGFAIPGGERIALMWWKKFLSWVFIGPAAAFMLLLITQIGTATAPINSGAGEIMRVFNEVAQLIIVMILLYATLVIGKLVGDTGGNWAADLGNRAVKRLGLTAKQAGIGGAKVATYLPRQAAKKTYEATRNQVRDFSGAAVKSVKQGITDSTGIKFANRDKDGKLKPGQVSAGLKAGQSLFGKGLSREQREQITKTSTEAQRLSGAVAAAGGGAPGGTAASLTRDTSKLHAADLRQGHVTDAIGTEEIVKNLTVALESDDIGALINNDTFMRSMDSSEQQQFINNIHVNAQVSAGDSAKHTAKALEKINKLNAT